MHADRQPLKAGTSQLVSGWVLGCAGEAARLQNYELQVLGSSSTGHQLSAAAGQASSSTGGSSQAPHLPQQPDFNWAWR